MVVTIRQILDSLDTFEGGYVSAADFGPEAIPHLETIIRTGKALQAAKAAYILGFIQDPKSVDVLNIAARSKRLEVRTAVAGACRHLNVHGVDDILNLLKNDAESQVKKRAIRSIELRNK
jgi:HEAT repeat protein